MDVTVVVPMYNAEATVGRCLDSIARQTVPPKRVIAVDDASTDRTVQVAREHRLPRLEIVTSARNRGPGAARNDGVSRATTDWVAFLDADNEWKPGFLEEVGAAITHVGAEFAASGGIRHFVSPKRATGYRVLPGDNSAAERSRDFWRIALRIQPVVPSSLVVRRDLFGQAGGFPEDMFTGEDVVLVARLWLRADRFAFVNRPLYDSFQGPGSLTVGRRRYRDLALMISRMGGVVIRAIYRRKAGTGWLIVAYSRMVIGRQVLWLRQAFRSRRAR